MLGRLLDMEITEYDTTIEEIELTCYMIGIRRRFLVRHTGEGFFRSAEVEPC